MLVDVVDMLAEFLTYGSQEAIDFRRRALDHKLHATIAQVSHKAGHLVQARQAADRVPEPDALHPSGVVKLATLLILTGRQRLIPPWTQV